MTDTEPNKALVKRYFTAIEEGDLTALDEVVSTDYQDHAAGRQPGTGALKAAAQPLRVAFPDMTTTVTHMLPETTSSPFATASQAHSAGPWANSRQRATASTSPPFSYFASKTSSSLNTGRSST